jgi:hypothetical protein
MELKDRKIQIVIWTNHSFSWNEGGTLVLFYLCKCINDLNHPIFYSKLYLPYEQQKIYPFSNIYYIYDEHEIDDNTIIIYPEDVCDNPLICKNVIRWLLQSTIKLITSWKDTDLIYIWDTCQTEFKNKTEKMLAIPYFNPIFKKKNNNERTKTCYLIKKGVYLHDKLIFLHPQDSILINNWDNLEYISNIFNECKYFYCYDPLCMYSIYAVSCGCITILYPKKNKTKYEYFKEGFLNKNNKIYNYGVAYGDSEEEIKFATDTLEEGEFMYKELCESYKDTLYDFIKDLEVYFKEH